TTTLHMAAGLLPPTAGRIDLGGHGSPADAQVRRRLGIAPQGLAVYDLLTAEENLRFFADLYGVPRAQAPARVPWALDVVGLTDRRGDRVETFSGGMKRRLNIAAALVHEPEILLLDEPTEGIQPSIILEIEDAIAELKRDGLSILLVEQYVDFAMRLADTYAVMDVGRIVAAGPTETFERERMQQLMSV
ncbi:MAG: ABC transporter ATP-binding protein, partial [Vicinamibacteria bacterium]